MLTMRGLTDRMPAATLAISLTTAALVGAAVAVFPPSALAVVAVMAAVVLFALALRWPAAAGYQRDGDLAYYRVLLWMILVNVPTFLEFDSSGLTHEHGLINAQSLARIAASLLIGIMFLAGCAVPHDGQPSAAKANLAKVFAAPLALYVWYTIDAPLVSRGTDLMLALFRTGEWFLLLAIAWKILRRSELAGRDGPASLLEVLLPVVFFPVIAILLAFPVIPSMVYQISTVTGLARLGGLFTHPNPLATLAGMAFFYMIGAWKGWRRVAGIALMLGVVILTYSRTGLVGVAMTLPVFLFVRTRSFQARVWIVIAGFLLAVAIIFGDFIMSSVKTYLQRGQPESNLATLSERTIVWEAAAVMINDSPVLGTGFVAGPKGLADVMMNFSTAAYFVAPNAHNELLQAQISGGVIATLLSLFIQVRLLFLWWTLRGVIDEPTRSVSLSWMMLLLIYGVLHPTFSAPVSLMSGTMLTLFLWFEHAYQKERAAIRAATGSLAGRPRQPWPEAMSAAK